jgi:hypothetical protein
MRQLAHISGSFDRLWLMMAGVVLVPALLQASPSAGTGVRLGAMRASPFADLSFGYDSNLRLAQGEVLALQSDLSYQVQDKAKSDYFSEYTAGLGFNRALESEWDLRMRAWYDARKYVTESQLDYDTMTAEASAIYWPANDNYRISLGGKVRDAEDVERVPVSSVTTMPGDAVLPYLEEQYDRLKRTSFDGIVDAQYRALERTDLSVGGKIATVDYKDKRLSDYQRWSTHGEAGYRFSEKTSFFGNMNYRLAEGDDLSRDVPIVGWLLGIQTKPRELLNYRLGVGGKTYEHATDSSGAQWKRKWDVDFDGLLNWQCAERMSIFGKAWSDVNAAVQVQERTRRTYAGQLGLNYYLVRRLSGAVAVSYRLDEYDFPISYEGVTQRQTDIWQYSGRLTLAPQNKAFWKAFAEGSFEQGDNDLDTYQQWTFRVGGAVWY